MSQWGISNTHTISNIHTICTQFPPLGSEGGRVTLNLLSLRFWQSWEVFLNIFSRPCSHCFVFVNVCLFNLVQSYSRGMLVAEPSQFSWEYIALLMLDVWVPIRNELDHDYILRPCPFWHIPERYLPYLGDPLQWINIKDFASEILHQLVLELDPLWWCSMISCFRDVLASGWIMPYIWNDNWFYEKGLRLT